MNPNNPPRSNGSNQPRSNNGSNQPRSNGNVPGQDPRFHNTPPNEPAKPFGSTPSNTPSDTSKTFSSDASRTNESTKTRAETTTEAIENAKNEGRSSDYNARNRSKDSESYDKKFKDTFENIKNSKQMDELYQYATENKEHTVAYIILAIGVVILFINSFVGGLIIGGVAGYYYSPEIIYFVRNLRVAFEQQRQVRFVVLIAVILALLLAAPGIFIGAVLVAALKHILWGRGSERNETKDRDNNP